MQRNSVGVHINAFTKSKILQPVFVLGFKIQYYKQCVLRLMQTNYFDKMTGAKIRAALFDLDGVVFDTESQYSIFGGNNVKNTILTNLDLRM